MTCWHVSGADTGRLGLPSQQVQDHSHGSETRERADDGRQRLPKTNGGQGDRTTAEAWGAVAGCFRCVTVSSSFS